MSSMEQHLPMQMSMLSNRTPPGNSSGRLTPSQPLLMEDFLTTSPAHVSGASDRFLPPSQILSAGSHAGAGDESRNRLPQLHRKEQTEQSLQITGKYS